MVSELYDDVTARSGAAVRQHKAERKNMERQLQAWVSTAYSTLAEAEEWLRRHSEPIPIMQRLEIPVLCLRWTHASINRKMMFGHGGGDDESIVKLVDQLHRGDKTTGDINQPLDVVQHRGNFCSLSNRRLTAVMLHQGLHRDRVVKAWCRTRNCDTQKFEEANTTTNEGLGIDTRDGES